MKLWQKNIESLKEVEKFTVGNDREFDLQLAPFDVLGSIAHAMMLAEVNLITREEADLVREELRNVYRSIHNSQFTIDNDVEDVHSQIELLLTQKLGDVGKKIHTARSRNDQVLVDIKLFLRHKIEQVVSGSTAFFGVAD